jgi:hypothetical protein
MFNAFRDDAAHVLLNRILESNAADGLKNRSRIIISYLETPGFDSFNRSDNVAFADAEKDPMLYNGVHVIWRGRAANINSTPSGATFDFLVGYDNKKTYEGIVQVTFDYAISINPERPLELLGRIIPVQSDRGIALEGVNFHQSTQLEN